MAYENNMQVISLQASADLSASQFCFVKLDTNAQLAVAGVDAAILGVLQDKPAAISRAGLVAINGITKVKCGGSITKGGRITSDASGQAIAVASGSAWSGGIALETGANGTIIAMLIDKTGAEVSALPT